MKKSLFRRWKELQVDKQAYTIYKPDITRYNITTLRQIAWVGMIAGIVLVIASLPPIALLDLLLGYASIAALFTVMVVLTHVVLEKHTKLVLPVYYGFIVTLLILSIFMGTFWGRDTNAITFVMMVIVVPLFIIDRPYRLNILIGVMCIAFCIIDFHVKNGILLNVDITNCIAFYILSIVVSRQAINTKMSDIIIKSQLKRQRDMDILTKLSNRGALERHVEQYIHDSNKGAIMLIMDLDNFKSVNDLMGHEYGDLVLKRVGEYMKETFRIGDMVSRLGGDEFVAFLPAVGELEVITSKVEGLIKRINGIRAELELDCEVSASVGIVRYPEDGCSFQELYRRADVALYDAKRKGKGIFIVYDEELEK